jgi:hypothetical protein
MPFTPEYKVLYANSIEELTTAVNAALLDGWTPSGGSQVFFLDPNDATQRFCSQAMTLNLHGVSHPRKHTKTRRKRKT